MKKLIAVLMMLLLQNACGAETEPTMEYVEDGLLSLVSEPYTILVAIPEQTVQETFGDQKTGCCYEAADGSYTIVTEVLEAGDISERVETISGIPAEQLHIFTLNRMPLTEYQFAWASSGEEGDTVSRCAVIASEDYDYVLTMTQQTGLDAAQQETLDQVFSSFQLGIDETV